MDVDGHTGFGFISELMPLLNELAQRNIIDEQNRLPPERPDTAQFWYDVNGDGYLTATGDVLPLVNAWNRNFSGVVAEGETGDTEHPSTTGLAEADSAPADQEQSPSSDLPPVVETFEISTDVYVTDEIVSRVAQSWNLPSAGQEEINDASLLELLD
jgi:hypothetical protein